MTVSVAAAVDVLFALFVEQKALSVAVAVVKPAVEIAIVVEVSDL